MRIRSIKPEFWRSSDISRLAIEDRLLFVGLWSYVDDNSVGIDKLAAIAADLFADDLEHDSRETFARVSRGLANLFEAGRIVRYRVSGTDYLRIVNWSKHQRIDKPAKPRFPLEDAENATIRESVARAPEKVPAEEQRNRGTEEQGVLVPLRTKSHQGEIQLSQRERINLGSKVVNEFLDTIPDVTFPAKIRQDLTAHATVSIQDGIDPAHISRGLQLWNEAGYPASTLPNSILQAQRESSGTTHGPRPRRATGTERAITGLALAEQLAQEERNGEK